MLLLSYYTGLFGDFRDQPARGVALRSLDNPKVLKIFTKIFTEIRANVNLFPSLLWTLTHIYLEFLGIKGFTRLVVLRYDNKGDV